MKFYCDSCSAKYLIGDEKVDGKVLRIRCKRCGHVMTVRGPTLPAGDVDSASVVEQDDGPVEWYYSRSGETFGPYTLVALQEMFGTGQLGDEAYVWKADFAAWVPARERAEFEEYFQRGQVRQPRRPTMNLRAEDLKAALVAVQSASSAAAASPAASPAVSGAGGVGASASAYRRVERPAEVHAKAGSSSGASLGAELGRSAAAKVASSPSHILKRASEAHDRAGGSPILSRPLESAAGAEEAQATPLAAPTDRLKALRERLQSRSPASSAFQAPGVLGRQPASVTPGPASPGEAAPVAAQPPAAGPDRPRPTSGLLSRPGVSPAAAAPSLKDRLQQREHPVVPVGHDEGEMVTEIASTRPEPSEPSRPLHVPVEEEIPELGDEELELEAVPSQEVPAAKRPQGGAKSPAPVALAVEPASMRSVAPVVPEKPVASPAVDGPSLADLVSEPAPRPGRKAAPPSSSEVEPLPRPVDPIPLASDTLMPMPGGARPEHHDDGPSSHSLLIQLEDLKKQRRRSRTMGIVGVVAVVFLVAVSLAAYFTFFSGPSAKQQKLADQAKEAREREASREVAAADLADRKGYKQDELEDLSNVIELGADEGEAVGGTNGAAQGGTNGGGGAQEEQPEGETPPAKEGEKAPREGGASPRPAEKKVGGGLDIAKGLLKDKKEGSLDGALASAGQVQDDEGGLKRRADSGSGAVARVDDQGSSVLGSDSNSVFRDIAASGNRERVEVKRVERERNPEGESPAALPSTLSKTDLVDGFRNVRHSADQCLERHMKRSGKLPKGKVKVIVTIEADGAVSAVRMDDELTNTVFESCMRSHTSRWRFPKFSGQALHVARVFLMQ